MSSSLRRGTLAAAALAFSIASLAACGAGNDAQTLEVKPDNAATTVGSIKIQNAIVITQPDKTASGPAAISATLFNNGTTAETLDAISVAGGTAEIKPARGKGKLTVPAGGSVVLGGKDNASAVLASPGESVKDGNAQKVTFSFSDTGPVSLRAFVVPAENFFSKWGPSEVPGAPGASGSPATGKSKKPSGTPTASASATGPSADTAASASATASASASNTAAGH